MLIHLGDGWFLEHERVVHHCGPDVRTFWKDGVKLCACGAQLPRAAQKFRVWLFDQLYEQPPQTRQQREAAA